MSCAPEWCRMGQREFDDCRRLEAMPTKKDSGKTDSGSMGSVQPGDVLVSHSSAVREHEISIVPHAPHAVSPSHDAALREGRSKADATGVDAWLTEDQTHVVKIASHRVPNEE